MFVRNAIKIKAMVGLALVGLLPVGSGALAQDGANWKDDTARIEKLKAVVVDGVETRRKLAQV